MGKLTCRLSFDVHKYNWFVFNLPDNNYVNGYL